MAQDSERHLWSSRQIRIAARQPSRPATSKWIAVGSNNFRSAEYEREEYQVRALLGMRILSDSVSCRAADLAATLASQIGGREKPRAMGPAGRAGASWR
jgi:hypothetical protein